MAGFVKSFRERLPGEMVDGRYAMLFYTAAHLPVFDALAARYAICDRWFCSHPGPTQPNRFCTLSGYTPLSTPPGADEPRADNFNIGSPGVRLCPDADAVRLSHRGGDRLGVLR